MFLPFTLYTPSWKLAYTTFQRVSLSLHRIGSGPVTGFIVNVSKVIGNMKYEY